jgi:hypothetical protein
MKAIFITASRNIKLSTIDNKDLMNNYNLYSPISNYKICMGVKPNDDEYNHKNFIATDIYNSVVFVSDNDDEIPLYYNELLIKYKNIFTN